MLEQFTKPILIPPSGYTATFWWHMQAAPAYERVSVNEAGTHTRLATESGEMMACRDPIGGRNSCSAVHDAIGSHSSVAVLWGQTYCLKPKGTARLAMPM